MNRLTTRGTGSSPALSSPAHPNLHASPHQPTPLMTTRRRWEPPHLAPETKVVDGTIKQKNSPFDHEGPSGFFTFGS
jgi:hypothetical protein